MAVDYVDGVSWLRRIIMFASYKNGDGELFQLEAPNGTMPITWSTLYPSSPLFRDLDNKLRKGTRFPRAKFVLRYSSNYIHKNKLLASEFVDVQFDGLNPPFLNSQFRFEAGSFTKKWFESTPITAEGDSFIERNPIPDGSEDFTFISTDIFQPLSEI